MGSCHVPTAAATTAAAAANAVRAEDAVLGREREQHALLHARIKHDGALRDAAGKPRLPLGAHHLLWHALRRTGCQDDPMGVGAHCRPQGRPHPGRVQVDLRGGVELHRVLRRLCTVGAAADRSVLGSFL